MWLDKTNVARRKTEVQLQAWTVSRGWLTPPPLLVGVTVAGHAMRIPRASLACSTRGLTPPALGRVPFAHRRNYDFCDAQTYMHRSGGREPAVRRADALAQAPPQLFGTLPTDVLADAVAIAFV